MRAVAYCRVSTSKEEQAMSLQNQKDFFETFITRKGDELVEIYSDEGLSGTKLKNRTALNRMIRDAGDGRFDIIYCKDISRLSRNTIDFLNIMRSLKQNGIGIFFIDLGDGREMDEFTLNLMALLAEQESAKISTRIKFGKQIRKDQGIVPNFVFGYDRVDKFTLVPNETEAPVVRKIFELYVREGLGMAKIGQYLYENGVKTKKNEQKQWSQKVVGDILRNRIYTGKIINGKTTMVDFRSSKRKTHGEEEWLVRDCPEIRLVDDELFNKAQELMRARYDSFPGDKKSKKSGAHLFSNLIKCDACGYSFRRNQRKYAEGGRTYAWWTCSKREAYGSERCVSQSVRIDEDWLAEGISNLLKYLIGDRKAFLNQVKAESKRLMKQYIREHVSSDTAELNERISKLTEQKERLVGMGEMGILSLEELKARVTPVNKQLEKLRFTLDENRKTEELTKKMEENISRFITQFDEYDLSAVMNNAALKEIIKEIRVRSKDEICVCFRVSNDLKGLDFPVEISRAFCPRRT